MKISHEVPRCLLTAQYEFNDYLYCLPHLLDQDKEYREFFLNAKAKGDYIIMDNSLHELGEAYNHKRLLHWVNEIEPDEFIVPDVWLDRAKTCVQAKYWKQFTYPEKTTITAVVQGKNFSEARLCSLALEGLGYKKLCISYGAPWYGETALQKALGRIIFVNEILKQPSLKHIKFHLLGCAVPQEFGWYENHSQIESLDTSNPIMAAIDGEIYTSQGLTEKPKANMNDDFEIMFEEIDYRDVLHNTTMFREINGFKPHNQYNTEAQFKSIKNG